MTKVVLREDEDGRIQYTGLDPITTTSLEDALNLLFYGDLNRIVEKTPMNDGSSRSHCIFMVQVESRSQRTGLIRRSRLNLVDLAGSERVAKTQVDGKILTEARRINLSLHYLEQVIVALHEQAQGSARVHVPYRNSMITTILKDSLGGNCRTVMVATVNVEQAQVDESISTCRFAQRVAMIVNDAKVNEELDPAIVIARLKRRVQELEAQLAVARPGDDADGEPAPFDDSARARCDTLVDEFVNSAADDDDEQASVTILSALAGDRIAYCLRRLKTLVGGAQQQRAASAGDAPANPHAIVRLKKVIEDRDNEIVRARHTLVPTTMRPSGFLTLCAGDPGWHAEGEGGERRRERQGGGRVDRRVADAGAGGRDRGATPGVRRVPDAGRLRDEEADAGGRRGPAGQDRRGQVAGRAVERDDEDDRHAEGPAAAAADAGVGPPDHRRGTVARRRQRDRRSGTTPGRGAARVRHAGRVVAPGQEGDRARAALDLQAARSHAEGVRQDVGGNARARASALTRACSGGTTARNATLQGRRSVTPRDDWWPRETPPLTPTSPGSIRRAARRRRQGRSRRPAPSAPYTSPISPAATDRPLCLPDEATVLSKTTANGTGGRFHIRHPAATRAYQPVSDGGSVDNGRVVGRATAHPLAQALTGP